MFCLNGFLTGGGGGANTLGYYLVSRSTNAPANAVNIGALTTGILKATISEGVATLSTVADGASAGGYYLVSRVTDAPTNAVNLGALSTGLLKLTVGGGIATPSIAAAGTDYASPLITISPRGTTGDISVAEASGAFVKVTAAITLTLPAGVAGYNLIVYSSGANAVSVKPATGEVIVLNGTALTANNKVTSTSTAGDMVTLIHDGTNWIVLGSSTWTDGGV